LRRFEVTASALSSPARIWPSTDWTSSKGHLYLVPAQSRDHLGRRAIGNVHDVDPGKPAKQLAREILGRADADAGKMMVPGADLAAAVRPFTSLTPSLVLVTSASPAVAVIDTMAKSLIGSNGSDL
jgi:hypothetical protein